MFVVAAVELTRKKKTSKKWAAPAQSLLRERAVKTSQKGCKIGQPPSILRKQSERSKNANVGPNIGQKRWNQTLHRRVRIREF